MASMAKIKSGIINGVSGNNGGDQKKSGNIENGESVKIA
jgi:hypothetical protein